MSGRRGQGPSPARWTMVGLCFAATAVNYLDRANLGLALPAIQSDFGLGASVMGLVLGGFFWTYALMQAPAGWMIDRWGPRIVYAAAAAAWSVFTMATSLCRGAVSLFTCRFLLGAGEAGAYPSNAKVTALWFPRTERAFASSVFDSGSRVGAALSWPVVGFLIAKLGWRGSFLVTGSLGFVWIAVWLCLYRNPGPGEGHEGSDGPAKDAGAPERTMPSMSWSSLLRHRTIWGMSLGFFCLNFVIYFFITWFPTYLVRARGFTMLQVGTVGAVPALCAVLGGWLGGFSSDALVRRGWSLTAARKSCLVGGMLLSSCIALAAVVDSEVWAVALFCISYASLAFTGANVWSLPADVAPSSDLVGSIAGIQNCASGIAGILTTSLTGVLLSLTHGSFVVPLLVGGVVSLTGAAVYLFVVGRIEPLGAPG